MVMLDQPGNAVAAKKSSVSMMNSNGDDAKDELHLSMMRILQGNPDATQRDLAKCLGGIN